MGKSNDENTTLSFLNYAPLYGYLQSFKYIKRPLARYKKENPYRLTLPDGTKATQKGFLDALKSIKED